MNNTSKAILILTLGARDIQANSSKLQSSFFDHIPRKKETLRFQNDRGQAQQVDSLVFPQFKASTETMAANLGKKDQLGNTLLDVLEYPIVKPAIQFILHPKRKNFLFKVLFVVTNQQSEKFSVLDSVFVPTIIQRLIQRDFPIHDTQFLPPIEIRQNPTRFSEVYQFFHQEFAKEIYQFTTEKIFLLREGGVPASNMALFLTCLETYPNLIELTKPAGLSTASISDTPQTFRKNYNRFAILQAIGRFEYGLLIDNSYPSPIVELATFAYSCLSLDFERAQHALEELMSSTNQEEDFFATLDQFLAHLRSQENPRTTFQIMYLAAKVKFWQQAYDDFLLKLLAVADQICSSEIERILSIQAPFNDRHTWELAIQARPSLFNYLANNSKTDRKREVPSPRQEIYIKIMEWHKQEGNPSSPYLTFSSTIEDLRKIRIHIAHSTIGINLEVIGSHIQSVEGNLTEAEKITQLFTDLDTYLEIDGFGMLYQINDYIEQSL